jgi:hypothetical protein
LSGTSRLSSVDRDLPSKKHDKPPTNDREYV